MTNNDREEILTPRLAALYSIRMQLDSLHLAIGSLILHEQEQIIERSSEPLEQGRDPSRCPNCGAPEEKTENVSTLDGTKRRHCSECGVTSVIGRRGIETTT